MGEQVHEAFDAWMISEDAPDLSSMPGELADRVWGMIRASWLESARRQAAATAVPMEVQRLLEELAQFAPPEGVVVAPTASMGFGIRAKRLLSGQSSLERVSILQDAQVRYAADSNADAPVVGGHEALVADLAALTRKLAHALRKAAPESDLPERATDYLRRKGLQGNPLRAAQAADEPSASVTPDAVWRAEGMPDPHGDRYQCARADLPMGDLTDDQLANAVFLHGNEPLDVAALLAGKPAPIAYLTAARDRIRWLSRQLAPARRTPGCCCMQRQMVMGCSCGAGLESGAISVIR